MEAAVEARQGQNLFLRHQLRANTSKVTNESQMTKISKELL